MNGIDTFPGFPKLAYVIHDAPGGATLGIRASKFGPIPGDGAHFRGESSVTLRASSRGMMITGDKHFPARGTHDVVPLRDASLALVGEHVPLEEGNRGVALGAGDFLDPEIIHDVREDGMGGVG